MLEVKPSKQFKKDFKKISNPKNNDSLKKFKEIIIKLSNNKELPSKNKDHQLKSNFKEFRECHVEPDLLLMYKITKKYLLLVRIGSHSDLFK